MCFGCFLSISLKKKRQNRPKLISAWKKKIFALKYIKICVLFPLYACKIKSIFFICVKMLYCCNYKSGFLLGTCRFCYKLNEICILKQKCNFIFNFFAWNIKWTDNNNTDLMKLLFHTVNTPVRTAHNQKPTTSHEGKRKKRRKHHHNTDILTNTAL